VQAVLVGTLVSVGAVSVIPIVRRLVNARAITIAVTVSIMIAVTIAIPGKVTIVIVVTMAMTIAIMVPIMISITVAISIAVSVPVAMTRRARGAVGAGAAARRVVTAVLGTGPFSIVTLAAIAVVVTAMPASAAA
jgi:hypothetical protein